MHLNLKARAKYLITLRSCMTCGEMIGRLADPTRAVRRCMGCIEEAEEARLSKRARPAVVRCRRCFRPFGVPVGGSGPLPGYCDTCRPWVGRRMTCRGCGVGIAKPENGGRQFCPACHEERRRRDNWPIQHFEPDDKPHRCATCRKRKPAEAFAPCSINARGRRGSCRQCEATKERERRADPEKRAAANAARRARVAADPELRARINAANRIRTNARRARLRAERVAPQD